MKKIIIIALIAFALFQVGKRSESESAPSKIDGADQEVSKKEKMEYFLEETYDGLAVCVSKCKEFISDVLS